jgi:hypothetical protein
LINRIIELPYVSNVINDSRIFVSLNESISLIDADEASLIFDNNGYLLEGKGVTIAFLDTGINYNHFDLRDNFLGGYDFVNEDNDPMDDNGHGTHCAGIAVGTGKISNYTIKGIAPKAKYYSYKVMDSNGIGYVSWFIEAMERSIDPNQDGDYSDSVDIISISAGDPYGNSNDTLSIAANNAVNLGVIVVASAGNNGPDYDSISSPGCAKNVICVGATDKNDNIALFSSRGSLSNDIIKPDILAPGVNIFSTWINGKYKVLSGTSMSCPHVVGSIALLLQKYPNFSPEDVKDSLITSAINLNYDRATQGYGRLNVLNSILSDGIPISKLLDFNFLDDGFVEIIGTALAKDFQSYKLYYKIEDNKIGNQSWIFLFENSLPVNNNILYLWNISLLNKEKYHIKLEVINNLLNITDKKTIHINESNSDSKIFIDSPDIIVEFEKFNVFLNNENGEMKKAFYLITFSNAFPRFKYGLSPYFIAPKILDKNITKDIGNITVFWFDEGLKTLNKTIMLNKKI